MRDGGAADGPRLPCHGEDVVVCELCATHPCVVVMRVMAESYVPVCPWTGVHQDGATRQVTDDEADLV